MDDVRAVMDAVGSERAAVIGVCEGGPMCALFAATHPDRRRPAGDAGRLREAQLGAGLPDRAPPSRTAGCADRRAVGPAVAAGGSCRARALDRRRRGGDRVVRVVHWRGASPAAAIALTDNERGDRRPPCPADGAGPGACHLPRREDLRAATRTWASGCRPRGWWSSRCRPPAVGGRPGGGAGRDRAFFDSAGRPDRVLPAAPHHRARSRGAATPSQRLDRLRLRALPRPHSTPRPAGVRAASTAPPARSAALPRSRGSSAHALRAGVHTGECELRDHGRLTGAALEIAARRRRAAAPGEILATSTVHDFVAGSGIEFSEHGRSRASSTTGSFLRHLTADKRDRPSLSAAPAVGARTAPRSRARRGVRGRPPPSMLPFVRRRSRARRRR